MYVAAIDAQTGPTGGPGGPGEHRADEYLSVDELVATVVEAAGRRIDVEHPVGVQSRNFSHDRIRSLGWRARVSLKEGSAHTYAWVEKQARVARF